MSAQLDLRQLSLPRETSEPVARAPRPWRRFLGRYALPAVVLLGFVALGAWASREWLLPARPVTVVPVVAMRAETQSAGTPLFQAPGWVEPRPTPILVPALAEGIVEQLLVVEGQTLEAGQPVARLIDTDARLELRQAEAELKLREAETEAARAELDGARLRLEHPVHLQAGLAEAQSLLAKAELQRAQLPFLIQAAEARLTFTRQNLAGKQAAEGAVSERLQQQALSEHAAATAELQELRGRQAPLQAELEALQRRSQALQRQLQLLVDEQRQVATAEARLQATMARQTVGQLAVEAARLRLERMTVRSPAAGRVLAVVAAPGSRVMGLAPHDEHKSTTVVTLYDPQLLQVRVDVRLEDVSQVEPGQPVVFTTASSREPCSGQVLQLTSRANIQKNTLEVKVALDAPPATIRPEMLVTATFLAASSSPTATDESSRQLRLFVPRQLIQSDGDRHLVWLADPAGVARRVAVRLGARLDGDLVAVEEGLRITDRLIASDRGQLREGLRIRIVAEASGSGLEAPGEAADPPTRSTTGSPTLSTTGSTATARH
ncbi:MAG: HlyD family efflux transporter periplasmic adaptor subunit [Pirellulaceae bacterium]|nr:HlyD family efflux transporter periplasmic adaptor subunit [Pirellulaceae bacterium]